MLAESVFRACPEAARLTGENVAIRLISLLRSVGEDGPVLASVKIKEDLLISEIRMLPPSELQRVSARAMHALANLAYRQEGRPAIRLDDWRMFLICLSSSRTLREAITRAGDFYRMLDERWGRVELRTHGETAEMRLDGLLHSRNLISFAADMMGLASLHGLFGWMIGECLPISMIHLPYGEQMRPHFDGSALPFPLTLGTRQSSIAFPVRYLDYPVTRSADDYGDRLILSCSAQVCEPPGDLCLAEHARLIMYRVLRDSHQLLSLEELSDRLGRSRATVRRQLDRAGLSYSQIKVSCRRELGLDLLRRSSLSVEEIAARLAFCDSDAFRSSFREWIGVSPSEFRKGGVLRQGTITVLSEHRWGVVAL